MNIFPADDARLKELILHVSQRCADWDGFATPLAHRMLFQADFLHFRLHGFPITGQTYLRGVLTPAPRTARRMAREMAEAGEMEFREEPTGDGLHARFFPRALREPDLRIFDGQEIALVERVVRHYRENAHAAAGNRDLLELPWEVAAIREEIPYSLALLGRLAAQPRDGGNAQRMPAERSLLRQEAVITAIKASAVLMPAARAQAIRTGASRALAARGVAP